MNDEDYWAVIAELSEQLRSIGLTELADSDSYLAPDDHNEVRPATPRKRLAEMLAAFERWLSIRDRQTYDEATRLLTEYSIPAPRKILSGVFLEGEYRVANLGDVGNFSDLRQMLRQLISLLPPTQGPDNPSDGGPTDGPQ